MTERAVTWLPPVRATLLGAGWPVLGLLLTVGLWWLGVHVLGRDSLMAARFAPEQAWEAAVALARQGDIWLHALASLQRVGLGLLIAIGVGVPVGLLVGSWPAFHRVTSTTFQFLRMISPLSWMPIVVMLLGIGNAPIYFLLIFAAVWPIIMNTAAGVRAINPQWLQLGQSLSATRWELLSRIVLPAVLGHILTGLRLAIGLIWVVLVPAEMLGVQAGLGYFILDTRDRMAYPELMATILFIGLLGFLLDWLARVAHRRWNGA